MLGACLPALLLWGGGWLYEKVRHREGLGFGDVKLMAMVGAFLGLRGALLTLVLGSLAGSLVGNSDNGDVVNSGMASDQIFEFRRSDLKLIFFN